MTTLKRREDDGNVRDYNYDCDYDDLDASIEIVGLTGGGDDDHDDDDDGNTTSPPVASLDFVSGGVESGHGSKVSAFGHDSLSAIGFMQNHVVSSGSEGSSGSDEEDKVDDNASKERRARREAARTSQSSNQSDEPRRPSAATKGSSGAFSKPRRSRIKTSSTIHLRPELEIRLEQRLSEIRMAASMSTLGLGNTLGGLSNAFAATGLASSSPGLPIEFEPDEEELQRQKHPTHGSNLPPPVHVNESQAGRKSKRPSPRIVIGDQDLESTPPSNAFSMQSLDPFDSVFEIAKQQYEEDFANSAIPDQTAKFPCFDLNEIVQGRFLGKGSFAQVVEVRDFCLNPIYEQLDTNQDSFGSDKGGNGKNPPPTFFTQSMHHRRHELADSAVDLDFDPEHDDEDVDDNGKSSSAGMADQDDFRHNSSSASQQDCSNKSDRRNDNNSEMSINNIQDGQESGEKATRDSLKEEDRFGYGDITDNEDDGNDGDDDDDSVIIRVDAAPLASSGNTTSSTTSSGRSSSRRFIAEHCYRTQTKTPHFVLKRKNSKLKILPKKKKPQRVVARYALKQLKKRISDDPRSLLQGIADMATESRVLSCMAHPNIVKLRGIARGPDVPFQRDYFILLDRLYDTLETRIYKWKAKEGKLQGGRGLLVDWKQSRRRQLWCDRVTFARDLSGALAYLHERHVMHRDLKPDNIGFDIRGDIKVFDFGLAKELPTIRNTHETLYNFTSMCGSPRYMAPEVGTEEAYNELCDVYSFGVLFWEMMALTKPYGTMSMSDLMHEVWVDDENARRPSPSLIEVGAFMSGRGIKRLLSRNWSSKRQQQQKNEEALPATGSPASLQALLEDCWANDLARRPCMSKIQERLEREVVAMHTAMEVGVDVGTTKRVDEETVEELEE